VHMKITHFTYYFLIVSFVLNPLIGILLILYCLYQFKVKNPVKYYRLLILFLAFFLSLVNITKIPENDLLFHGFNYLYAGKYDLIEYILWIGKEPFFYMFNYIFYHISNGSFKLWVFTISFVSYYLLLIAVLKYCLYNRFSKGQMLMAFMLASFFPQMFSLSAHLLRQFVASSVFVYFAVDYIYYKKNKWWLPFMGMLIHFSSILIFPMVYLNFLGDFKKYKVLNIFLLVFLFFYQKIAELLLMVIGSINPILSYVLIRASADTTFDLGGFQLLNYVLMFFMVGIAICFLFLRGKEHHNNTVETESYFKSRHFIYILVYLSVFILANIHQSELSNRLFFYSFFFFPFITPLVLNLKVKINHTYLSFFVSNVFILYFLFRLEFGVWTYDSLLEIMSKPVFLYLTEPDFILRNIR
jgi:hypothetical protein